MTSEKAVGQTKDVGFQVGARKTIAVSPQTVWDFLTSAEGFRLWLGELSNWQLEKGARYKTTEGTVGEFRVINPGTGGHLRLTWQPRHWDNPSTVQVRIIPNKEKTTISFHQEHLQDAQTREAMRQRWQQVLDKLAEQLPNNNG